MAAQADLARGEDGTGKYLSCTHSMLRRIAETRPATLADLDRIGGLGAQKLDRFGVAFLDILAGG
jgi:ATP-dependent DNA helicase RecQ